MRWQRGRKAFAGLSQAILISAIMTAEPPLISTLQSMTPLALDHFVRTCLAKDPEASWQTAHDVLVELKWLKEAGSQASVTEPIGARRRTPDTIVMTCNSLTVRWMVGLFPTPIVNTSAESQCIPNFDRFLGQLHEIRRWLSTPNKSFAVDGQTAQNLFVPKIAELGV
jgi:hypothetical protein